MYPVEFYRTVQADRHQRLSRLARRARRAAAPAAHSAQAVTVEGPSGRVLLSGDGVTCLDAPVAAARR